MPEVTTPDHLSDADLVEVAFADGPVEAEMIQGLLQDGGIASLLRSTGVNGPVLGIGLLPRGSQQVMVRVDQAEAARALLAEIMVERDLEVEELANAAYLDDARGRGPRSYGLIGAYARIWIWSIVALGVAFGVFLLARVT
jgi:Putative prokaryotic signal transducing protein